MSWKKVKLGELLKNREGRYKPYDSAIAGLKRIDKINFSGQIFLSDKDSNTDMILVKKGDLVISGINVEKGALAVYEGEEDILATIHYSSYIYDKTKIDIDFLKVFLRSPDFMQLLKEQVPGGIKTEIKPKHILQLEVYFPETTAEQKSIAKHFFENEIKLNLLNEHISHQLTLLDKLNQAILQEAVQGKLVPQDPNDEPASELLKRIKAEKLNNSDPSGRRKKEKPLPPIKPEEIPFEIPENWVWCRLGEIAKQINDGTHHTPKYVKEGIPFLSIKDISGGSIDFSNTKFITKEEHLELIKRCYPERNDILFCRIGTLGRPSIIETDIEFSIFVSLGLIKTYSNIYEVRYLKYLLESPLLYYQYQQIKADGIHTPKLNLRDVPNLLIPLPPLSEQKRIVAEIENQFAKTKL